MIKNRSVMTIKNYKNYKRKRYIIQYDSRNL